MYSVRCMYVVIRRMFGRSITVKAHLWDKQTGKGIALIGRKA
jgi:hypothetical protein